MYGTNRGGRLRHSVSLKKLRNSVGMNEQLGEDEVKERPCLVEGGEVKAVMEGKH